MIIDCQIFERLLFEDSTCIRSADLSDVVMLIFADRVSVDSRRDWRAPR